MWTQTDSSPPRSASTPAWRAQPLKDLLAVFVWTAGVNTVTADLVGTLASKLAPQKLG